MIPKDIEQAFLSSQAVNEVLLAHLTPEMLEARVSPSSYTVAGHLAHLAYCLKEWFAVLDADTAAQFPDLYQQQGEEYIAERNLERIRAVYHQMYPVVLQGAKNATHKGELPHPSVSQFLMHMALHDAHHRGQMMLALKVSGFALPEEDDMWSPLRS